ncbi:MAG: methyltransferase domain-containing protein [bacterium]
MRVLVPGCGRGHDVEALARAGLQVTGLDLSPTALALAAAWSARSPGSSGSAAISLALPADRPAAYDAVVEHLLRAAPRPARRLPATRCGASAPAAACSARSCSSTTLAAPPMGPARGLAGPLRRALPDPAPQTAPEAFRPRGVPQLEVVFEKVD